MNIVRMISDNPNHYDGVNPCNYITIHETDNTDKGSDALMHGLYINNGSSETWHYTVDDERVIQHFNDEVQCWHAGTDKGNKQSIGIELCVNSDGDYNKMIENAMELIIFLMTKHNRNIDSVVQHNYWSRKDCPRRLRNVYSGITWGIFTKRIENNSETPHMEDLIDDLVIRTIRGDFGNGAERKNKLGSYYDNVQNIINGNDKMVDIDELVQRTIRGDFGNGDERKRKLGSNYNEVQDVINGDSYSVNIDDLVQRTIRGEFGNGAERKNKLGIQYNDVQRQINKIYS